MGEALVVEIDQALVLDVVLLLRCLPFAVPGLPTKRDPTAVRPLQEKVPTAGRQEGAYKAPTGDTRPGTSVPNTMNPPAVERRRGPRSLGRNWKCTDTPKY